MSRTMNKDYGAQGDGKLAPNILVAGPIEISGSLEFPRGSNTELNKYLDGASAGSATTIGSTILDRTLALNLTGENIAEAPVCATAILPIKVFERIEKIYNEWKNVN